MSRRKMFSASMIVILIILFINLFLPFVEDEYESYSFWDFTVLENAYGGSVLRVIVILELVAALVICTLQLVGIMNDFKGVYLTLGYYFTYYISSLFNFMDEDVYYIAKLGVWIGIIFSLIGIIATAVGNHMNNETNPKMYDDNGGNGPIGYDPKTGRPIYAPVMNNNQMGYNQPQGRPYYR